MRYLIKMLMFLFCFRRGRRILLSSFVIILLFIFFCNFGPQPFRMSPLQEQVGNALVEKAVERFPWSADVGSVMMIVEEDAWAPFFQNAIRSRVMNYNSDGSRKFDISPDSFSARVVKSLGFKNDTGILTDAQIEQIKKTMKEDTLLIIKFSVSDYCETAEYAKGRLLCVFHRKGSCQPLKVEVDVIQDKDVGVFKKMSFYFKSMTKVHRLVWAVLGVLLFPFLTAPITLSITKRKSAKMNGFMIFVYSLVLFVIEGIMFSAPSDFFEACIACVCGVSIVWYLLKTCDMLASPGFRRRMQIFKK